MHTHLIICLLFLLGLGVLRAPNVKIQQGQAAEAVSITGNLSQPALQSQWWRSAPAILAISIIGSLLLLAGSWLAFGQQLTWWQYGIIGSAAFTGLAHIMIGSTYEGELLLLLDGLGFFGFLGALYLPLTLFRRFRPLLRWSLLFYTLFGFTAYFIIHILYGHFGELALLIKTAEFLLMGLLIGRLRGMGKATATT